MNEKETVSIIVPVYNVRKYLRGCLDSIVGQSYDNIEIILVDDGSMDDSGAICDEYAKKDSRIIVIHRENGGQSAARNTGIERAGGNYLLYVDSDDSIHRDTVKKLLSLLEETGADISIGQFKLVNEGDNIKDGDLSGPDRVLAGVEALRQVLYGGLYGTTACGILMKREIAVSNLFPVGMNHEDDFVSFRFYAMAEKVAVTDNCLYYYLQHEGSIMHREYGRIDRDELVAADHIVDECAKLGKKEKKAALARKFCNYGQVLLDNEDLSRKDPETYERIKRELKGIRAGVLFDGNAPKRMRYNALLYILGGEKLFKKKHK